jgi:hypothetical protein
MISQEEFKLSPKKSKHSWDGALLRAKLSAQGAEIKDSQDFRIRGLLAHHHGLNPNGGKEKRKKLLLIISNCGPPKNLFPPFFSTFSCYSTSVLNKLGLATYKFLEI